MSPKDDPIIDSLQHFRGSIKKNRSAHFPTSFGDSAPFHDSTGDNTHDRRIETSLNYNDFKLQVLIDKTNLASDQVLDLNDIICRISQNLSINKDIGNKGEFISAVRNFYGGTPHSMTYSQILGYVANYNNEKNISDVKGNIKMPLIDFPVSYDGRSISQNYVQVFDLQHKKFNLLDTRSHQIVKGYSYKEIEKNSSLVAFKFDRESFLQLLYEQGNWKGIKAIIRNMNNETFNYLAKDRTVKIIPCELSNADIERTYLLNLENPSLDLSDLTIDDFGDFYLFDIFKKDTCTHGMKVYDVIRQVLRNYRLDTTISKVRRIPINYFSNREECDRIYAEAKGVDSPYMIHAVDSLTYESKKEKDTISDIDYLKDIYTYFSSKGADIVSSSYVASCTIPFFQTTLNDYDSTTNYFASATNDSLNIDLLEQKSSTLLEPLASYIIRFPVDGAIIVGNQMSPGVMHGMYSNKGNITTLGRGVSWGLKDCTKCIADTDMGCSFATPEIATKLFIAKAYWRKYEKGIITATESRRRLILASNLHPRLIQKIASSGDVNLNKLLQYKSGYLVDLRDSVISLDSVIDASIVLLSTDGRKHFDFSTREEENNIRGFYLSEQKAFIFQNTGEQRDKWVELGKPIKISLAYRLPNDATNYNIITQTFLDNYKQIVLLK